MNQAATVLGNTARHGDGGGLLVEGALSGNQAVFQQNQSGGHGGGAFVTGTVSLQDSQFILNAAHGEVGGGLFALGSAAISNSLFLTNTADFSPTALLAGDPAGAEPPTSLNGPAAGSPEGGGLFANHDVNLLNDLFMNNHATFNGHGGSAAVSASCPHSRPRATATGSSATQPAPKEAAWRLTMPSR